MAYKIAFFGAKPYDIASFDKINERYEFDIRYYKGHLNINNVVLTQGVDAVCIFVNAVQRSGLIEYLSPSEIAPDGHSSIHVPQAIQSSPITYAIIINV